MDFKSELKNLVFYVKCQQDAMTLGNPREVAYYGKFVRRSLDGVDRWADMADAAVAYMEHQATNVYDPDDCDLKYAQQRARMWDAFIMARAKVKGVNDGPT